LEGAQLEALDIDNMRLDHHDPHLLAANEALHRTPHAYRTQE
jgi:hypothetical protein